MRALLALSVAALSTTVAGPARAQVAVAVAIADEDTSQRAIAAEVVQLARQKWQMLSPQLPAAKARGCKAGDTACLRDVAAAAAATHLLVVGVAPLGVRDRVVAVQLFDVKNNAPLFEESTVQPGLADELTEVRGLAERLVRVEGPPTAQPPPVFVPGAPAASSALSVWDWSGFVLVGAGGVTAAVSSITGALLVEGRDPDAARNVLFFGLATAGALAGLGTVALVVD